MSQFKKTHKNFKEKERLFLQAVLNDVVVVVVENQITKNVRLGIKTSNEILIMS